jgi:hypothetical protein
VLVLGPSVTELWVHRARAGQGRAWRPAGRPRIDWRSNAAGTGSMGLRIRLLGIMPGYICTYIMGCCRQKYSVGSRQPVLGLAPWQLSEAPIILPRR